jgi:HK97 gp10 family phage protein
MSYDRDRMLQIFGTDELIQLFNSLEPEIGDEIVNKLFRKSAKLIIAKVKTNADNLGHENKSGKKTIADSVTSSLKKSEKRIIIGTLRRKGGAFAPIFDKGTEARYTKKGKSTGSIKKTDFFWGAVREVQNEIRENLSIETQKRLVKTVKKMNKLNKTPAK